MKKLKVDSIDGTYIYCKDKEKNMFAIEKKEISLTIKKGDFISIDDNGQLTIDD